MKEVPEGWLEEVLLTDTRGDTGFYTMLATRNGDVYCGHASGRVLPMMPIEMSQWKESFYIEFKKIGLVRYQFYMVNRLNGERCVFYTWRAFGKILLDLVNAQQRPMSS